MEESLLLPIYKINSSSYHNWDSHSLVSMWSNWKKISYDEAEKRCNEAGIKNEKQVFFTHLSIKKQFRQYEDNEKFLYLLNIPWWLHGAKELNWIDYFNIPDEVIQKCKLGQAIITVYNAWEGWSWGSFKLIVDKICQKYNLTYDNFIMLNACTGLAEIRRINAHLFQTTFSYFFHDHVKKAHEKFIQQIKTDIQNCKIRKYKFICLNRRARINRWVVMLELFEDRHKGVLSFAMDEFTLSSLYEQTENWREEHTKQVQMHLEKIPDYKFFNEYSDPISRLDKETYVKYVNKIKELDVKSHLPLLIDDEVDPRTNPTDLDNNKTIDLCANTYLYIVTETSVIKEYLNDERSNEVDYVDASFLTEKTFKPIMLFQPFVIIGRQHILKVLRDLDYLTFSDFIDESYDDESDDIIRVVKAINSAKHFYNRPSIEISKDLKSMYWILEHNYNTIISNVNNIQKNIYDQFQKYLHI